jgi:hypothetical protein
MVTVDAIVRLTAICIAFQALGVLSVGWMRFLRPFRIPVSVNAPTTSPDEFVGLQCRWLLAAGSWSINWSRFDRQMMAK